LVATLRLESHWTKGKIKFNGGEQEVRSTLELLDVFEQRHAEKICDFCRTTVAVFNFMAACSGKVVSRVIRLHPRALK
jgi:hypothetical protein